MPFPARIRCYPMHIENPATANVERSSQYDPTLNPIRSWRPAPAPTSLANVFLCSRGERESARARKS